VPYRPSGWTCNDRCLYGTEPSPEAQAKKATKRNAAGLPVMAFGDLMDHLSC
jgi:hypothetical protein